LEWRGFGDRSSVLTNILTWRLGYARTWPTMLHQFSKADREKAWQVLERMDIEDQAHKPARELSGGQQQRVGISRALMQDPELMLADEPVASLDPVLAHSILQHLEKLNIEDKLTIICSLHYLDLVQRYSTSVIGLREGKLVYQGTKDDIQNMTNDEFKQIYGEEAVRISGGLDGNLEGTIAP